MLTNPSIFPLYETVGKFFSNTRVFRRLKKSQCHDNCRFSDTVICVVLMSSVLALPPSHLSVLVGEDTLLLAFQTVGCAVGVVADYTGVFLAICGDSGIAVLVVSLCLYAHEVCRCHQYGSDK